MALVAQTLVVVALETLPEGHPRTPQLGWEVGDAGFGEIGGIVVSVGDSWTQGFGGMGGFVKDVIDEDQLYQEMGENGSV